MLERTWHCDTSAFADGRGLTKSALVHALATLGSKLSRMTAIRIVAGATVMTIFAASVAAQEPEALIIDPGQTTITLHVGRAGVFAFAGHDHEVVVPAMQGRITLDRANVSRSPCR